MVEVEFEKLFWEKRFFIEKIVRKYISSTDLVDDLLQQIFLKIYLQFNKVKKAENQNSYLYKLALNEIFDYFRKNKKYTKEITISDNFIELIDKTILPEDSFFAKEVKEHFFSLLTEFPQKRRMVIGLRILEEKSFSEISKDLSISEDSAKNIFSQGIKKLRLKLMKILEKKEVQYAK